jgi:hypothetical protein
MSSGGQRGIDVSGVTSMRLQTASDVTSQRSLQLVYKTYASTTGANAFMGDQVNATGAYLQFLQGLKESVGTEGGCTTCSTLLGPGLPYQYRATWTFRNRI